MKTQVFWENKIKCIRNTFKRDAKNISRESFMNTHGKLKNQKKLLC
jgi:hypothetical protein